MTPNSESTSTPTPGRKVIFVPVDTRRGGLPVKRKQVQHACHECRRRKKRCIHNVGPHDGGPTSVKNVTLQGPGEISQSQNSLEPLIGSSRSPVDHPPTVNANENVATDHLLEQSNVSLPTAPAPAPSIVPPLFPPGAALRLRSRFVGDLNPEGMFIEATGAASATESSQKGDVGIWHSGSAAGASGQPSQFITARPPPVMDRFLLPFVREHCLSCLPPEADFLRLKAFYSEKIHPIFPIIPLAALHGDLENPSIIMLRQLVSLAAGTDPDTSQNLRLANRGSEILSAQDFSQALSSSIRAILETSIISDRVIHIRAFTMLSLYTQPTCPEEADLPAQLGGRAIHHIQTLGLHLLRYDAPNCDDLENLFCAVWALDRINGALYGRPSLMHERDIGANLGECIKKRPPCFRLFLGVVQWLEQVVDLYRPGPSEEASGYEKVAYIDLPVFEAMIVDADALKVPSSLIATIETFYHAVIILSCRLPRPGTVPAASTLPPPSANARRSLAAERIACAVPRDCLSPVLFVPYAVSLALSVEYRKMRHSRLPMFRARAMNAFKRNCQMLRNFGDYFWSANVVAGLGERVLKEMERAATSLREASPVPVPADTDNDNGEATCLGYGNMRQGDNLACDSFAIDVGSGLENMVDFSAVDAISGQDVFGHIDPNFNLTAVEDALEANLDIGLPLNWGDWGQLFVT